jgi:putative transposase
MSDYRRYFIPGGTYFFTLVTARRVPIFERPLARELLGNALRDCIQHSPYSFVAMVLLPDHLHAIWTLPSLDQDYSFRWSWIKRRFTMDWLAIGGAEQAIGSANRRERRRGVWQRRFWEHAIRDENDLELHFDYVHANPVKHGYVAAARDWPWSTFHQYVRSGHYAMDWASLANAELPGNAGE